MQLSSDRALKNRWALPAMLAVVLGLVTAIGVVTRMRNIGPEAEESTEPTGETVRLEIDFGNGQRRAVAIGWRERMTVHDALAAAAARDPRLAFSYQGRGAAAMLTALGEAKNEGGGAAAKNWTYRVNGQQADRSFAIYPVEPDDVILWTYESGN